MKTQIFYQETLDKAATLLKEGEVVAFPTETVYGLGAIATSQEAVLKVFEAKGRPSDNPLIVHVYSVDQVINTVEEFPENAKLLAKYFWPGPLTMILKAKPGIYAPALSAGLPTVSFRMPNHELTLSLIEQVGIPLVGPSANQSTKPSPTRVQHVVEDMDGRIAGIVDGGDTSVGVESTVIDLTNEEGPVILRPGVITKEEIEPIIGPLVEYMKTTTGEKVTPKSPGMKYRHYAPTTPVVVVEGSLEFWYQLISEYQEQGEIIAVMATNDILDAVSSKVEESYSLGEKDSLADMSHHLFNALRSLDHTEATIILAQASGKEGAGLAYMNRLEKASSFTKTER